MDEEQPSILYAACSTRHALCSRFCHLNRVEKGLSAWYDPPDAETQVRLATAT